MSTEAAITPMYEMKGPSALSGDPRRFFHLSYILAVTEFRIRFYDSALGYLWTVVRPLALFGVIYAVFSTVVDIDAGVDHYPALLLVAMVLFFAFNEATSKAVTSVVDYENLVRKIQFPRAVIPASVTLTASLFLALNLIAVFFFVFVDGVTPRLAWLQLPLLIAILLLFSLGLAMILSVLYVVARDVKPIWEVVLQALFYLTPVLYPIELVQQESTKLAEVVMFNPLAAIIQQARHAVVDADAPTAAAAIGGTPRLLIPAGIILATCALGFWLFNRMAPQIAEEL